MNSIFKSIYSKFIDRYLENYYLDFGMYDVIKYQDEQRKKNSPLYKGKQRVREVVGSINKKLEQNSSSLNFL